MECICKKEIENCEVQRKKIGGAINALVKVRGFYEEMLILTLLYGCETLKWYEYDKSRGVSCGNKFFKTRKN